MQTTSRASDWSLLQQYVNTNSQEAFAALAGRHLNLVYATALREVGDAGTAEDVTQAVFLLLARKAPTLRAETHLGGWLFQTARFVSKNARTREMRRRQTEQKAAQMMAAEQNAQDDALWQSINPRLNDALARLPRGDREALLLRFWDAQSLAETGAALGVSEDAARKRVARALEKLRRLLGDPAAPVSAEALATLLPAHAVSAAPAALAPAIGQMMIGAVAGHVPEGIAGSSATQLMNGALHAMKLAQIKTIALLTAAVLVGLTTYAVAREVPFQHKNIRVSENSRVADTAVQPPEWKPQPGDISGTPLTSEQIGERCREAYAALQTYQVKVLVWSRALVGTPQQSVVSHTSADIEFERPGKIHAAATSANAALPMPPQTYEYVSTGSATYMRDTNTGTGWRKAQNADDAIDSYQGVAHAAISALPAVLLETQTYSPFPPTLAYNPVVEQGTLDGHPCYLVAAHTKTAIGTETKAFYIDSKTFLLREYVTDSVGVVKPLSQSVMVQSHNVQVYSDEKINAPIPESVFAAPPAQ